MALDTVTVVNRYPHDITLAIYDKVAIAARRGVQDMTVPTPLRQQTIRGAKHDPRYIPQQNIMLGCGGRTTVSADLWSAWVAENARNPLVTNNLIFAEPTAARASSRLAELLTERTGFEGIDQTNLADKRLRVERSKEHEPDYGEV